MIELLPAIDLLGGRVVRLEQGDRARVTVYAADPGATADGFVADGAQSLHVVDLDAAFDGPQARQIRAIGAIVKYSGGLPVQLGGGLRDLDGIAAAFDLGISRVLLGTLAVERRDLLAQALKRWGPARIAVAVDEKDGLVKTRGWVEGPASLMAVDFAKELAHDGARIFLHSAIARDGTLSGPDVEALRRIAGAVSPLGGEVICAGGVGTLDHLRALRVAAIDGVTGAVAGRAIYEKVFTVSEGRRALEGS